MKDIPVHLLQDRTSLGLDIDQFVIGDLPDDESEAMGAHRDDHYIFFVMEDGAASLMIDFNEVCLTGGMLYYVLPTQVHHRIRSEAAGGWFLAVDTALIPPECRNVFENQLLLQPPYMLTATQLTQFNNILLMLLAKYREDDANPFYLPAVRSLLQSFLAMAASCYNCSVGASMKASRPAEITSQFKSLLIAGVRTIKGPSEYAARLNVSESYLNESLKKTTGFPVSYWIQQEVMMEAKRLLYYSSLTVKEIAHTLGYTDHSYFSRLFRKSVGQSALTFRAQYRK